jgi:hypothetical protein
MSAIFWLSVRTLTERLVANDLPPYTQILPRSQGKEPLEAERTEALANGRNVAQLQRAE